MSVWEVFLLKELIDFMVDKQDKIIEMLGEHCRMVLISLAISIIIGVIVGYLITYNRYVANVVLYITSIFMTIPSLALFAVLAPILGLNETPVIVGLVIYTLLPIVRNTYVGLNNVDINVINAAQGMGLTSFEITRKIRIPLALPVILAGIRTAVVLGIGIGAIAAYIGEGGLGVYIFQGINRGNIYMVLSSAILIALLTIVVDKLFLAFQKMAEKHIA